MRTIGAALRTLLVLALLGGITSAIAAAFARGRLISRGGPGDDEIDLVAIYDSLDFQSHAPALRQARVTTWYGGGTVDLRGATLGPAGATLTVRAIFGGIRLVIPETWRVELRANAVMGGVGDARDTANVGPGGPALIIDGWAIFGGVAIVSAAPDIESAGWAEAEAAAEITEPAAVPA